MTAPVNYDESLPPELLAGYTAPLEAAAPRRVLAATARLVVAAGEPGSYDPEVAAGERPRNVTELRERARPDGYAPWPAGAYVLVGTSGKRAHWGGDDWHGGESPGYAAPPAAEAPEVTELVADGTGEALPDAPGQDGDTELPDARA